MEQRSEPRIALTTEIRVDVLGDAPRTFEAGLIDISSRGMRFALEQPLAPDAALRILLGGDQYLAEVTYCHKAGARYIAGVSLFNVIRNIDEVSERLGRMLMAR